MHSVRESERACIRLPTGQGATGCQDHRPLMEQQTAEFEASQTAVKGKHPGWAASCRFRVPCRPVAYAVRGPLSGRNPRARVFSAYADARRRRPRPFSCRSDGFALWGPGVPADAGAGMLPNGALEAAAGRPADMPGRHADSLDWHFQWRPRALNG